jgi:hypothetical protein
MALSNKASLIEKIKRRLGHPMVRVELTDDHYLDAVDYSVKKFRKWAAGQSTQETFFTMMLSGGQYLYELPDGVVEVLSYDHGTYKGINTLFTVENYLYNEGMFDTILKNKGDFDFVSYHIALDFLESVDRYSVDAFNFKYHPGTNILEIQPPPPTGSDTLGYDSPGWVLLRTYMIEGSTLPGWTEDVHTDSMYNSTWILDYATALCKISLGMIRRKFASFAALGNSPGINMDGETLVSEGKEEKAALDLALHTEEVYEGMPIIIG